tara:strand:+ start:433 stop:732 length:300 start_codon:yes stop_codon:yes gene_type:complete
MKLRKNNNYFESFEKLDYIEKNNLAMQYFKASEDLKRFIKSNSVFIELDTIKYCIRCAKSFKSGWIGFKNFYCCNCLKSASYENAKTILKDTITERDNN